MKTFARFTAFGFLAIALAMFLGGWTLLAADWGTSIQASDGAALGLVAMLGGASKLLGAGLMLSSLPYAAIGQALWLLAAITDDTNDLRRRTLALAEDGQQTKQYVRALIRSLSESVQQDRALDSFERETSEKGKYAPLEVHLLSVPSGQNEVTLQFEGIERMLEAELPPSAYQYQAWWANEADGLHVQAHAWLNAGWIVDHVDQDRRLVRFRRA